MMWRVRSKVDEEILKEGMSCLDEVGTDTLG